MLMNSSRTLAAAALTLAVCVTGTAQAHHSFSMFDNAKCLTITGTVRNFEWNFPHSWIWLTVPDNNGGADIWGFEGEPPSNLSQKGWTKKSLKKGEKVTLKYSPLKNGQMGGAYSSVTLSDGKVLPSIRGPNDICAPKT